MQDSLNSQQKAAVLSDSKALAIIAGPGTGKTKTLVARLIYLLETKRIAPEKIIALTFTKKAAAEVKERVKDKYKFTPPFIGTFHALALYLLNTNPAIASQKQQLGIVTKKELNEISRYKNNLEDNELVRKYNEKLQEMGLIDYDDLLLQLYNALAKHKLDLKIEHILVDEFQDTNRLQYEILKLLSAKNYFVIGDPMQSIYSFRGSNEKIFDRFCNDFDKAEIIKLVSNYRNSAEILTTYQSLFNNSLPLTPMMKDLGEVTLLETSNEWSEADWIVSTIKSKTGGVDMRDATETDATFSDFAILYRTHRFKKALEKKFKDSGIPYQIVGGGSIYEDEEIQLLMHKVLEKGSNFTGSLSQIITSAATQLKISEDKTTELLSLIYQFENKENGLNLLADYINSLSESDYYDPLANRVTLLTMHAAKGLEFSCVFVCGCEENIIPHKNSDSEEEKRLFYVALSRAKKNLFLTKAKRRNKKDTTNSPFLSLLPKNIVITKNDKQGVKRLERIRKNNLKKSQISMF